MADYLSSNREGQAAVPVQSLMSDLANCNDNARAILDIVRKLQDTLHGSLPRDAKSVGERPSEPMPTARRYIDQQQALLSEIDMELRAIGTRL